MTDPALAEKSAAADSRAERIRAVLEEAMARVNRATLDGAHDDGELGCGSLTEGCPGICGSLTGCHAGSLSDH